MTIKTLAFSMFHGKYETHWLIFQEKVIVKMFIACANFFRSGQTKPAAEEVLQRLQGSYGNEIIT